MTPAVRWLSFPRIGAAAARWRGAIGYAAFTLAVFLLALLYGLPHELIARRALAEVATDLHVHINFSDVGFAFPNGYDFDRVRISPLDHPERVVEIEELTVRIPIWSLLFGSADSAYFSGRVYGGSFDGRAEQLDGAITANLEASDVRLGPLSRALLPPPGVVNGTASLKIRAEGRGRRLTAGTLTAHARALSLEGLVAQGITVPDLSFDEVDVEAAIDGTRLRIDTATASGSELSVAAKGDVLLREPVERSVLNLELELDVSPEARPGLRVATALLPKRGPTQPPGWSLRGSLAAPSLR